MLIYFDFSQAMRVLQNHILKEFYTNQVEFLDWFFEEGKKATKADYGEDLASRYLTGDRPFDKHLVMHYLSEDREKLLSGAIKKNVLPKMADSAMVAETLRRSMTQAVNIHELERRDLLGHRDFINDDEIADYMAAVICFSMQLPTRNQRDKLVEKGKLPALPADLICKTGVPEPCPWFQGREKELKALHKNMLKKRHVFVRGIQGIGKSEFAKAYAQRYGDTYVEKLYIACDEGLENGILNMGFASDLPDDSHNTLFNRHRILLKSFRENTLLILDNLNDPEDPLLDEILCYRCSILITTQIYDNNLCNFELRKLNKTSLYKLFQYFYLGWEDNERILKQIIRRVYGHTMTVELIARILAFGLQTPRSVLRKLKENPTIVDVPEKIETNRNGRRRKATYRDHIRMLFGLLDLPEEEASIMLNMGLIPASGVPMALFKEWLGLEDCNSILNLVELGLIQLRPGGIIALHALIRDVVETDMQPSVNSCWILLWSLRNVCLAHGWDDPYHEWTHQTIDGIMRHILVDDAEEYILFLEDAFQSMEKYKYKSGMLRIVAALTKMLKDESVGTAKDRVVLLMCRYACECDPAVGLGYLQKALELVPELDESTAALHANLHNNIGLCLWKIKNLEWAGDHMQKGIHILEDYNLGDTHDCAIQIINYAGLLAAQGDHARGYIALTKLADRYKEKNRTKSIDYAEILMNQGLVLMADKKYVQAAVHLQEARALFEKIGTYVPEIWEENRIQIDMAREKIQKKLRNLS